VGLNLDKCLLCDQKGSDVVVLDKLYDTRFGIDTDYSISKCNECGLEHTLPIPKENELLRLYHTYYNFGGAKKNIYTMAREWFLFSSVYIVWVFVDGDISFHKKRGSGRLLDIGCNEGRGLQIYRQNGFEAEGLEVNEKAASEARNRGFNVHSELMEKFHPERPFDVAVLSNVLEHFLDPGDMLENVKRVLKTDGEVWISCPNSRSWLRGLFGRYWINWHVPFHIVHFSPLTLKNLLEKSGFNDIHIRQETPVLWVSLSIISYLFAKKGKPTRQLRNPILITFLMITIRGLLFPLLWIENLRGKGDCLVATARKS
jgi:SAM-dependent methyltransferase